MPSTIILKIILRSKKLNKNFKPKQWMPWRCSNNNNNSSRKPWLCQLKLKQRCNKISRTLDKVRRLIKAWSLGSSTSKPRKSLIRPCRKQSKTRVPSSLSTEEPSCNSRRCKNINKLLHNKNNSKCRWPCKSLKKCLLLQALTTLLHSKTLPRLTCKMLKKEKSSARFLRSTSSSPHPKKN